MSIRLEHVSKSYKSGHDAAVDDVSLEVGDGEFMVLVGPSGCGKSTLLKLIAGIEETTAGHIFIGDRDVTLLDPMKIDRKSTRLNSSHMSISYAVFCLKKKKIKKTHKQHKPQQRLQRAVE